MGRDRGGLEEMHSISKHERNDISCINAIQFCPELMKFWSLPWLGIFISYKFEISARAKTKTNLRSLYSILHKYLNTCNDLVEN